MKIYHTETQADYDALMVELEAQGFMWSSGRKLSENNIWYVIEHLTCIRVYDSEVDYASLNYYKEEYSHIPITKYKAKADEKMRFTKENVMLLLKTHGGIALDEAIKNLDDTPEKVVVPKFVADWIELCKEKANLVDCLQGGYRHFNGCESIGKDEDWLFEGNNQDVVARAWLDGYEVEEEPLYHVANKDGGLILFKFGGVVFATPSPASLTIDKFGHKPSYQLTEKEIKDYDERYWPFAKPIEEEEE